MSYDQRRPVSVPGCVAKPPEHATGYRGYDHMRCAHPTPPPAGWRRCAADPGCEVRLPDTSPNRRCPPHADLYWGVPTSDRYEELMDAKPPKPVRVLP